ncbi:MAG TPA: DNA repair protein RecN [Devosia sp.]|nr:DNA repair protein RecN [Devosia sp.]
MLSAISVRNIVLIDQLDIGLEGGLTALTGETGAGKSILLDALTLALGGRGDASLVRNGAESGQVVAVLQLPAEHPARVALRDNEIADDAELIMRRVQYADGRTRAFINDQPVGAGLMQAIGRRLVEIHGQHDDRALVDAAVHRGLLDAFGGLSGDAGATAAAHGALAATAAEVAAQRQVIAEAAAREDYARHVVEELAQLNPESGEEEALAERRTRLMQLEKAADEVRDADEILGGPAAPGPALAGLMRRLARKVDGGMGVFQPLVDAIEGTLNALDRTEEAVETLKREMAFDPAELEQVEGRLFALRAMARKHHVLADELGAVLRKYRDELEALQSGEANLARLEAAETAAREVYLKAARRLSAARAKAAKALSKAVEAELPDLKLGTARFIVDQQVDETRVAATGFDQVAFQVQTNPGTLPGPLMKVASGGELSRFLLALKVVLADRGSAPVLIFDEIDTGVGGAVADAIGRRLKRLSERVQVLTVTHAPQVAARSDMHLFIEKQAIEEGAFVRTHVRRLDGAARREEIARMLAGATITAEARAAAGKLLSDVA